MAGELWGFATTIYARPGVAAGCIDVQDRFGVDVTYILAAAWAGDRGLAVDREALLDWDLQCSAWREEVVLPLRRQRRTWAEAAGQDYRAIKVLELDAEREMLARLEALLPATRDTVAGVDEDSRSSLARANIAATLHFFSVPEAVAAELALLMMPSER